MPFTCSSPGTDARNDILQSGIDRVIVFAKSKMAAAHILLLDESRKALSWIVLTEGEMSWKNAKTSETENDVIDLPVVKTRQIKRWQHLMAISCNSLVLRLEGGHSHRHLREVDCSLAIVGRLATWH